MKTRYKTREELIANIQLTIAKKNEYIAHVQREWAEQNLHKIRQGV